MKKRQLEADTQKPPTNGDKPPTAAVRPSPPAEQTAPPLLITENDKLDRYIERWARAPRLALDLEANGLHVYRAELCALQIGWRENDRMHIAVVDTLKVDPARLLTLFGCDGPLKLLHDFTFDASLLQQHGITLGHVEDTSVAARFLGEPATGLASLAGKYLDLSLSKKLQSHNWARRPFTDEQLSYLASDVAHLFTLRDLLWEQSEALDIREEIRQECEYKLMMALNPRPPSEPPYMRIKGYKRLNDERRAVVRSLHACREELAQKANRPPHHLASNRLLFDLASGNLQSPSTLRRRFSSQRAFRSHADSWVEAVRRGLAGDAPSEPKVKPPPRMSRREISIRKQLSGVLNNWRKSEASRRGVDVQVVIPGHCTSPLVDALLTSDARPNDTPKLAAVAGFGDVRIKRYHSKLIELTHKADKAAQKLLDENR